MIMSPLSQNVDVSVGVPGPTLSDGFHNLLSIYNSKIVPHVGPSREQD